METIFKFIYELQAKEVYCVLNSQFTSSVFGALLGAFAGAYAAHRIASYAKRKEDLEAQVRAVNVAISTAFLICNSALGLKKQHINDLYNKYVQDRERYEGTLANPPKGGVIQFDLKTLHMPYMPVEILEKNAYEKLSIKGRPLALISTIANSIETLRSCLDYRNNLIDRFKRLFPTIPDESRFDYYFGFPLPNDSVNQEYSDSMKGIYQYTDDVIFFSSLLCDDLKLHGEAIRKTYKKVYGKNTDQIAGFDFKTPEALAIWPNEADYRDWMDMFVERKAEVSWYKRIFATNKPIKKDAHTRASS
jgi:hypothetical protein